MISQGARWRCAVVVAFVGVSALAACASKDPSRADARASTGLGATDLAGEPERVVQRMAPAPVASSAMASGATRPGSARPTESISPRHLEAELNRLEAEIGR